MKKKGFGLIIVFLLFGANLFAANGDLIVNGNIGIGTSTPAYKLDVNGYIRGSSDIILTRSDMDPAIWTLPGSNKGIRYIVRGSGNHRFQVDDVDKVVINNSGNVGIGTSSPTYKLQLGSDSAAKPSTSTWTIASDARLKTNIQPYTKGLKEILLINPVSYQYNGKGGIGHYKEKDPLTDKDVGSDLVDTELLSKTNVGVIAQDIQAVVPETVTSHRGKINEDDADETDILDFNSHSLTFILINAVKELKAEIDSLNKQVADLKAKAK